jgi:ATP-dependent Lhr-like helicase
MARAITDQDIEPLTPILAPLDVLAQVIVGMVALEAVDRGDLYHRIRCAAPYHGLTERQFNLVLEMLGGRYAHTRLRALKARVAVDPFTGAVKARRGALQALYLSGGTIPDRGYYTLRRHRQGGRSGDRIGELDEEFVWEAKIGQAFTLGTQNWQICKITASDVFVRPAPGRGAPPPFWRADGGGRDAHFATRIADFLEWIDGRLDAPELADALQADYHLDPSAAEQLIHWLRRQRRHTGCPLPHRHHLVAERIDAGPGGAPGHQLALHAPWGGRLTWPMALALEAALEEAFGQAPEVFAGDDIVLLVNPPDIGADHLLSLVEEDRLLPLLRRRLERSGYFGARFRTAAGRALLVARGGLRRRMPLWMTRLKAQKLLAAVMPLEEFPLLLEAWRSCLKDGFDLETLRARLRELAGGGIAVSEVATSRPSPMAQAAAWGQINEYMYRDDRGREGGRSKLQEDLLREAVFSESLRPAIAPGLVASFQSKRQRTAPGYAPADGLELVAWVRDRLLLPAAEWRRLLERMACDHAADPDALLQTVGGRLVRLMIPGCRSAEGGPVTTHDMAAFLMTALWGAAGDRMAVRPLTGSAPPEASEVAGEAPPPAEVLLAQWLSYYGPVEPAWIQATLGLDGRRLEAWVDRLVRDERLIRGTLLESDETVRVCDAENYEILLRMGRAERRGAVDPLPLADLPLLLARHQGLVHERKPPDASAARRSSTEGSDAVRHHLSRLTGWPAGAPHWETEILPARLPSYRPAWLDVVLQEGELIWRGCGPERLTFCYQDELDLLETSRTDGGEAASGAGNEGQFPGMTADRAARYPFAALAAERPREQVYEALWQQVWAGGMVNDNFQALRQGIANRFRWPAPGGAASAVIPISRPGRRRYAAGRPRQLQVPGNWYRPLPPPPPEDELAALELDKERVRLLLQRYGILFRPLLARELAAFSWGRLFRALRLMELAGEVVGGHFVEGVPGPQFVSPEMLRAISRGGDREAIFFLNAADPASLCGLGLDWDEVAADGGASTPAESGRLPARRPSTHLVYHGRRLVMVSRRQGRRLSFYVENSSPHLNRYLNVVDHILKYRTNGSAGVVVETINHLPAPRSPYLAALKARFEVMVGPNRVTVYQPWTSSA